MNNKNKLTPKQEGFSLDILRELSETKAYQNHYNTRNMSIEAVYVEACRLRALPKVSLRIEELQAEVKSQAVMEVSEKREFYAKVTRNDGEAMKHRLRATDYDSKLAKHYEAPLTYQDNRVVNFIVPDEETKALLEKALAGKMRVIEEEK